MTINVNVGYKDYNIYVQRGILEKAAEVINLNRKVMIVTDSGVPKEYAEKIKAQCKEGHIFVFKEGEDSKTLATFEDILSEMLKLGFTRKDAVVAVGGGVAGDLAGFVASSFMRGIDFYNIPTTVLSQVDSSIGGKVAVNLKGIKNIVGAFYQPKAVLIDAETLNTLPKRQISAGIAEALKMACTFDKELFEKIEDAKDPIDIIDEIIVKSLKIKRDVVEQDEKEAGLRKVLNFGHTAGHAVEAVAHSSLYHGECVALGMLVVSADNVKERLINIYKKLNLPTSFKGDKTALSSAVLHDKKGSGKTVTVIVSNKVGEFDMKEETFEEIIQRMEEFFK